MKLILSLASACLICSAANASEIVVYTYDAKGRLIRVQHTGGPAASLDTQYQYDLADNRTQVVVAIGSGAGGGTGPGGPGGPFLPGDPGGPGGGPECIDIATGLSVPCQ